MYLNGLILHFPQARSLKPSGNDDGDGHAAAEYDRGNDTHQLGHNAAFELPQFITGIDKHGVNGGDAAAHGVGCLQLDNCAADHDTDTVHHPAAHQSKEGQKIDLRETKDDYTEAKPGHRVEQGFALMVPEGPEGKREDHAY